MSGWNGSPPSRPARKSAKLFVNVCSYPIVQPGTHHLSMYGCSKFTLHEDGRIVGQRDFYDLWGDIFAGVPGMKKLYPAFMRRLFA